MGELKHDSRAHRATDEIGALKAMRRLKSCKGIAKRRDRRPPGERRRRTKTGQVERDHLTLRGELLDDRRPRPVIRPKTVHEEQWPAGTSSDVIQHHTATVA